jgi:hypothetical protein
MDKKLQEMTDRICELIRQEEQDKKLLMLAFIDYLLAKAEDNERNHYDINSKEKNKNNVIEEARL